MSSTQGWLQNVRKIGKICFIDIRRPSSKGDEGGVLQFLTKDADLAKKILGIPRESYVRVSGQTCGSDSLCTTITLLSRELAENPYHLGKKDSPPVSLKDTRLHSLEIKKGQALKAIRDTLESKGFLPTLFQGLLPVATEGGTELYELKDDRGCLAQSPQLEKQKRVSSGISRVYGIGNAYRAENHDTSRHANQFIMVDYEMATLALSEVIGVAKAIIVATAGVFCKVLTDNDFKMLSYEQACRNLGVERIARQEEIRLFDIYPSEFIIITGYPSEEKPFYCKGHENFDILHRRMEVASGGLREVNYQALLENLQTKGISRQGLQSYLEVFRHGPCPTGGAGIGFCRLIAIFSESKTVRCCNPYWDRGLPRL